MLADVDNEREGAQPFARGAYRNHARGYHKARSARRLSATLPAAVIPRPERARSAGGAPLQGAHSAEPGLSARGYQEARSARRLSVTLPASVIPRPERARSAGSAPCTGRTQRRARALSPGISQGSFGPSLKRHSSSRRYSAP